MSVWYCIPSARPVGEVDPIVREWTYRGYNVALYRDAQAAAVPSATRNVHGKYTGYAAAVNALCRMVLAEDGQCGWVVTGGDDILPDPILDADTIAKQCTTFFKGTLGVMQPTGDRHMVDVQGRCAADRVCVSPWMGREWCLRSYNGKGPMCEQYYHFYVDEDLHSVADRMGLLWHRRDITQYHQYWGRVRGKSRPEHLQKAAQMWSDAKAIFEQRQRSGFPKSNLK